MNNHIQIAIDGYAGCGKSTTAKIVAEKTGFIFIDSGAMYRAVTLYFLEQEVNLERDEEVRHHLANVHLTFKKEHGEQVLYLNGEDTKDKIRSMAVNRHVSQVASLEAVRTFLVAQQQALGLTQSIVMDGRDIGTVVFPDAHVKIFMKADVPERAKRRQAELQVKGEHVPLQELADNIRQRDHMDTTREISPLRQAQDAIVIDTTGMTIEAQTEQVLSLIREKTTWQP